MPEIWSVYKCDYDNYILVNQLLALQSWEHW